VSSLRVLPSDPPSPPPKIRASRSKKWRAVVLIAIHVVIAAHVAHWLIAGRTVTPVEPSEAMAFSKAGLVNAGLIFFAATILLTAVFGRFFCGWACHLVALQDLCLWLLQKVGIRPMPLRSRLLRVVPFAAFGYMFLWPVAYRLWIGDRFDRFSVELTTTEFWSTFPGWIVGGLTFLVCGFAAVYFLGAKGFCTYACPYGAIFAAADRVAPMRIRVTDACSGCGHCTAVCTSNVRVHQEVRDYGMVVDSGCMKCRDCVSVCPNDALYYGPGPIPLVAAPRVARPEPRLYPLRWWEEGVLGAAFVAAFFAFRGLYGAVPFLMALGLAGVVAYLMLVAVRLAVRPHVAQRRIALKRGGRLTPAGWAFAAGMAGLAALWVHSGWIGWHAWRAEAAFARTAELRRAALAAPEGETAPALAAADRALAAAALGHLERVDRGGLLPTPGNAYRLAWLHHLAGRPEAMRPAAEAAIARGEWPAQMHLLLAREALGRGDLARSAAAYEGAIAAEPRFAEAYLGLGVALAERGHLDHAGEAFARGLAKLPRSSALAYNLGLVRALQNRPADAIALFERALALEPGHRPARENLAGVLAATGRFDDSARHYRRALEQAPDDAETRLLLARVLAEQGRLAAAEQEAREALRRVPGWGDAEALLLALEAARDESEGG
jgi:polyferredoxin/Tfp pilus assembly protein PilF